MLVTKIISGGQTGGDRGALEAARDLGFPYGGLIPKGRRAEATEEDLAAGRREGVVPLEFDGMEVSPRKDYLFRTEWNVAHSDATLVIARRGNPITEGDKGCSEYLFLGPTNSDYLAGGTRRTVEFCRQHVRPYLILFEGNVPRVLDWLRALRAEQAAAHGEGRTSRPHLPATALTDGCATTAVTARRDGRLQHDRSIHGMQGKP